MSSTIDIISHPDCGRHEMGQAHPESPARLRAIDDALAESGLRLRQIEAPRATREQLERAHSARHIDDLFARAPRTGYVQLDADTTLNPHTIPAALRAAGAAVKAVDLVLGGSARSVFCNIRPPGHHAERERAMGFCLFNNVAVGAAHALEMHALERIAIIDFDVHHGNGTEDIFREEPRVLFCSSFQHPLYPGSGADTESDHILNLPLAAGTDGTGYRRAVEEQWLGRLDSFRPQLIFFSAGFDAHVADPLADLRLVESDYSWLTHEVMAIAARHGARGSVSLLEGGYNLGALGRGVVAHLRSLAGDVSEGGAAG